METIRIDEDITVFYVTATSFPEGIPDATKKLQPVSSLIRKNGEYSDSPGLKTTGKSFTGLPQKKWKKTKLPKLKCETLLIKKGNYVFLVVDDFRKDVTGIDRAFKQLLLAPDLGSPWLLCGMV